MKIGIVSDTHSQKLPKQMLDDFKEADFIIHAGDFCSADVLAQLQRMKEVKGVYGNMDEPEVRKLLPRKQIIGCGGFSIGIFHGEGAPKNLLEVVKNEFKDAKVDCVIFGHSHQTMNAVMNNVLYFNPGSPTDLVVAPFRSYGILEIEKNITAKIIKVK